MNKLSVERFNRANDAGTILPRDALETALSELDKEDIKSIVIIGIDSNNNQISYFAGPHVSSLRKLWTILQYELLRVVERMVG